MGNQIKNKSNIPSLSAKEIKARVFTRIKKYEHLKFLEQSAMFLGRAQILEFFLKNLLTSKFGYKLERIEKWTLGRTKNELILCCVRRDYIVLLQSVVDYRNYIAHEIFVKQAISESLLTNYSFHSEKNMLYKAIYELEQIIFLSELCQKNDAWLEH
jgi:hypothetical protein